MSLALYIARRLPLRADRGPGSGGIAVAVTGISLSVVVMLLSISVMTGFREEICNKIIGFDAEVTVAPADLSADGKSWLDMTKLENTIAASLPEGAKVSPTMRQPAIMKAPEDFAGVVIKGIPAGYASDFIAGNLVAGAMPDYSADSTLYSIVISRIIADKLGADLGDRIDTYFMGGGIYRVRRLRVAGIYDTHFSDYDRHMAYASLPMLRQVASLPDSSAMAIEISGLGSDRDIDMVSDRLVTELSLLACADPATTPMSVVNIHRTAALYFNWLALLDTNVAVILTLMALLSCLTLVSSLFILILRRVGMIGILKAMGASNALIRRTFILLTLRILLLGLLAGNAVATGIILLQRATGFLPLDPEAYYLDSVPMALPAGAWLLLNAAVAALSFAILLLPSAIIATIPPSRAIKYE
ncbi:MAG: ABC transporter permease [Duncaniella sp.]|nr:ABC transporter permease [Duncaniella sp.]